MVAIVQTPVAGGLFAVDFDRPEAASTSAVIEPVFSAIELAAARDAARGEGYAAGVREAVERDAAATRLAITAIAEQIAHACEDASARAETAAEAIARLLLGSLAAMLPTLGARYGDAEVRAIMRVVLPALTQEPTITVRTHPYTATAVEQEIARLDPELATHIETVACDGMAPGDVRIAWRSGNATRDATALWEQVAAVLAPAGLLRTDAAIEEMIDGG